MNLSEFLSYKTECPICDHKLVTYFHDHKNQLIRYEDDRLVFIFNMLPLKRKGTKYKIGFSFGLYNNSYQIEFYDENMVRKESIIQLFLIDKFKELNKNYIYQKLYGFYRHCDECGGYSYQSNLFNLNFTQNKIKELIISNEFIGLLSKNEQEEYIYYRLRNDYIDCKSKLIYGKSDCDRDCATFLTHHKLYEHTQFKSIKNTIELDTNLIKITSSLELYDKLNKLTIFL